MGRLTPRPRGGSQPGTATPLLRVFSLALTVAYLATAQCIVDNPGGSKANIYRPTDSDVPTATFSPLAHVNETLPDWLCFTAGYRMRYEGYTAGSFQTANSDSYLLTRFRLGMLLKPLRWLKVYTELQDADAFWKDPKVPPYQSTWDLRRAYVDLGDIEQDPIAFRVGRQDLSFGWQRLLGTSYWRNASRGWDAAMMIVNWKMLRVNAFAAAPVINYDNGLSHHQPGNDLHGIYSRWRNLLPQSDLEPYLLWHLAPGVKTEAGPLAKLDEKTVGLRWAGTPSHWDYDAEIADQFGNIGTDAIRAWGWSGIAGYTFGSSALKPRLSFKYDYASGDRNPKDGVHGTFDQLYPNIHDHHGLADQVAWQNLVSVRTVFRASVRRNWMISGAFNDWWLANAKDGFYNSSGSIVARDTRGVSGTHIGTELDLQTSYRFDRNLEVGTGVGHIFSGDLLLNTGHARAYTYPYVMLQYNFF